MDRLLIDLCTTDRPVQTAPPVLAAAGWVPASYIVPTLLAPTGLGFKRVSDGVVVYVANLIDMLYTFESAPDVSGSPGAWSVIASGIAAGRWTDNLVTGAGAWYRVRGVDTNGFVTAYTTPAFWTPVQLLNAESVVVNGSGQVTGWVTNDGSSGGIFDFLSSSFKITADTGTYSGVVVFRYDASINQCAFNSPVSFNNSFWLGLGLVRADQYGYQVRGTGPSGSFANMGADDSLGVFFKKSEPGGSNANTKGWIRIGLDAASRLTAADVTVPGNTTLTNTADIVLSTGAAITGRFSSTKDHLVTQQMMVADGTGATAIATGKWAGVVYNSGGYDGGLFFAYNFATSAYMPVKLQGLTASLSNSANELFRAGSVTNGNKAEVYDIDAAVFREVGYRNIPMRTQDTSANFAASDRGKGIKKTGTTAITYTVLNSTHATDDMICALNANSTGALTVAPGSGVTMYKNGTTTTGSVTVAPRGMVSLFFESPSVVYASGPGVT